MRRKSGPGSRQSGGEWQKLHGGSGKWARVEKQAEETMRFLLTKLRATGAGVCDCAERSGETDKSAARNGRTCFWQMYIVQYVFHKNPVFAEKTIGDSLSA